MLLRVPSFEAYSVWALYKNDEDYRIRRIEWDPGMKLPQPGQPTLPKEAMGSEVGFDSVTGAALLGELGAMSVPVVQTPKRFGLDGVSYAIVTGSYLCSTELSWWQEPPDGWSELGDWFDRAVAAFDAVLPPSPFGDSRLR